MEYDDRNLQIAWPQIFSRHPGENHSACYWKRLHPFCCIVRGLIEVACNAVGSTALKLDGRLAKAMDIIIILIIIIIIIIMASYIERISVTRCFKGKVHIW